MKRQRHSEEQIIVVLQEAQAGATIEELCRRHGISQGTYYKWKQKFSGMEVNGRSASAPARRREPQAQEAGGRPGP